MWEKVFLILWDRDGGRPGGWMILCGNGADIVGWVGREGVSLPPGCKADGRRRGWGGFIFNLRNNKRQSLGPEWSLSEAGTSPPHDSDTPHGLVNSNTHIYTFPEIFFQNLCSPPLPPDYNQIFFILDHLIHII